MSSTSAVKASRPIAQQSPAYSAPGLSLREAFQIFARCGNSQIIAGMLTVATVLRVTLGGWTWADAEVVGAILVLEPFTEWVIHITALHAKPATIRGRTFDLYIAKRHRSHHQDPKVIKHVLIPKAVLVRVVIGAWPLFYFATPTLRQAAAGLVTSFGMLMLYEWTHFLIHSTYTPRSWYYRYIWRAHRLHHYKNEKYWYGVTVHLADHLLRTFPRRDAVETSPTARTLGVDAA